jgi:hypothetical protein
VQQSRLIQSKRITNAAKRLPAAIVPVPFRTETKKAPTS